jgi:hypothetical protein
MQPALRNKYDPPVSALATEWIVFAWRLPTGPSTARVGLWRRLRRLGAGALTPGAAILPFREELEEQFDWLAQEVDEQGGAAWVLPVTRLSEPEEQRIIAQIRADRDEEYAEVHNGALSFLDRAGGRGTRDAEFNERLRIDKELLALQRRFRKIRARDHFRAPGRSQAAAAIDRCLNFRQGVSAKLSAVTDDLAVES